MSEAVYFISDAHILPIDAPGERAKQHHLISFLQSIRGSAKALYVTGDLFDFWFEYRSVLPARGARVLAALADLVDSGTSVTVFGGNHDWWVGSHLEREFGIAVRHKPLRIREQGLTVYIDHGDGSWSESWAYAIVRKVIHSRWAARAFGLLHPDLADRIASFVSGNTDPEGPQHSEAQQLAPVYANACAHLFADGVDVALFGHVHAARVEAHEKGTLVVLGEWVSLGTYAELRDGAISLKTWRGQTDVPWPPLRP